MYWRDLRALEIQVLEPDLGPTKTLNMTFCASRSNWTHAALREELAERDAACLVFGVLGDLRSRFFFFLERRGNSHANLQTIRGAARPLFSLFFLEGYPVVSYITLHRKKSSLVALMPVKIPRHFLILLSLILLFFLR